MLYIRPGQTLTKSCWFYVHRVSALLINQFCKKKLQENVGGNKKQLFKQLIQNQLSFNNRTPWKHVVNRRRDDHFSANGEAAEPPEAEVSEAALRAAPKLVA